MTSTLRTVFTATRAALLVVSASLPAQAANGGRASRHERLRCRDPDDSRRLSGRRAGWRAHFRRNAGRGLWRSRSGECSGQWTAVRREQSADSQ
jgi:hypothetical protein